MFGITKFLVSNAIPQGWNYTYQNLCFCQETSKNKQILESSIQISLKGVPQMPIFLYVIKTLEHYIEKTATMENEDNQNIKYEPFDYHDFVQHQALNEKPADEDINPLDNIVFTDEPNLKVFCHDCRKQINKTTSILTTTNSIYRCVGCFAKQTPSEVPYQVIKSLNFPIIDHNWKANHEILLLTFLQKHGFNNWTDIRQQMEYYGAKFSVAELQAHYYEYYLSNDDFLPRILNNEDFFQKKQQQPTTLKTNINPASIASLTTNQRQEQQLEHYGEIEDFEIQELIKPKKGNNKEKEKENNFQFCNEKRKEFDVEYDPDAELMLANLEFRDDDSQEEKAIKYTLLDLYNKRLEKRYQIKNFVIEHRLLDSKYQEEKNKQRSQFERESFQQLKPVARFMKLTEFNELIQKVAFTKQLKSIIEGLRKFRRTHPSNFKSLDQFISNQPEQSKPKKKGHGQNGVRIGKRAQQMLQKRFNLNKKQFQNIVTNLAANGKTVYKNIQAVMLQRNCE